MVRENIDIPGESWDLVGTVPVPAGDVARQIEPDREDPRILYALTHTSFVRSEDGGATWDGVGDATLPDLKLNGVATDPAKPSTLYLACDVGVYRSKSRGDSWSLLNKGLPNAIVMQVFHKNDYLYAATFGRGLWRTKL